MPDATWQRIQTIVALEAENDRLQAELEEWKDKYARLSEWVTENVR